MSYKEIENPFLFLEAYSLEKKFSLEGRDNESDLLFSLLQWKDIIIVFGRSGVGKTSFVNHALSDKIYDVNWLPVRVTRQRNINDTLRTELQASLKCNHPKLLYESPVNGSSIDAVGDIQSAQNENLTSDSVQLVNELYRKWYRPVYLIIDQIEELFLLGNEDEKKLFLRTLSNLLKEKDLQKKIILVLREEHLSYIQEIERIINGVFQDGLSIIRINQFDSGKIYDSVIKCVEDHKLYIDLVAPFKDNIIQKCLSDGQFDVQLLQIVLYILWENIINNTKRGTKPITELIDDLTKPESNPLNDYVYKIVNSDYGKDANLLKAPYWHILRKCISPAETKWPVSLKELTKDFKPEIFKVSKGNVEEWCDDLVKKKLLEELPLIKQKDKDRYYQLKHDVLVPIIKQLDPQLKLRFPKKGTDSFRSKHIPYKGLKQYNENDSDEFYGRSDLIKEYKDFLLQKGNNCLVVVGDSGTGKSSMVKAGLLPEMGKEGYAINILRPEHPLYDFQEKIQTLIAEKSPDKKLCIYIDQFEECYTYLGSNEHNYKHDKSLSAQEFEFKQFLEFIRDKIFIKDFNVKLIVSIRHDYAHEFDRKIGVWRQFKKLLRYPNKDEVFEIVVGPALENGVDFSPKNLPEMIAADAINTSFFLPLLSFTMNELYWYDIVDNNGKELTLKGYNNIGGIVGCLQKSFSKAYDSLMESDQKFFALLMPRMIIIKDTIPKAARLYTDSINFSQGDKNEQAKTILSKFEWVGIFQQNTEKSGKNTRHYYEPIHDSLLSYCDQIRDIINSEHGKKQIDLQAKLEVAIKKWKESGHNESLLWHKHDKLNVLLEALNNPEKNWLFSQEENFVRKSQNYEDELIYAEEKVKERKRKSKNIILILSSISLLVIAMVLYYSNKKLRSINNDLVYVTYLKDVANYELQERTDSLNLKNLELYSVKKELELKNKFLADESTQQTTLLRENTKYIKELRSSEAHSMRKSIILSSQKKTRDSLLLESEKKRLTIVRQLEKIKSIDSIERAVNQISKLNTLATENIRQSPGLSYQLTQEVLSINSQDTTALKTRKSLIEKPYFFETLVVNNVEFDKTSRDSSRIITVERDEQSGNIFQVTIWTTTGTREYSLPVERNLKTVDISPDNSKLIMLETNKLKLISLSDKQEKSLTRSDLNFVQFAENDNRFFAVSQDSIYVYNSSLSDPDVISFENDGNIISATLTENAIVIKTPDRVRFINVFKKKEYSKGYIFSKIPFFKGSQYSIKKYPQSFVFKNGRVIAMGNRGKIILLDSSEKKIWSKRLDKEFKTINNFSTNANAQYAILQFNKTRKLEETDLINQQMKVQQIAEKTIGQEKYVYIFNLSNGEFNSLDNFQTDNLQLSGSNDSLIDYTQGTISVYNINNGKRGSSIGDKTRFTKAIPLNRSNSLFLSKNANGQLKVWKLFKAGELNNRKQLWQFEDDIKKITGIQ